MYRGPRCPKCVAGWVTHTYRKRNGKEYLLMKCHGCGYSWREPCADAWKKRAG